jgi:hypothetical protein
MRHVHTCTRCHDRDAAERQQQDDDEKERASEGERGRHREAEQGWPPCQHPGDTAGMAHDLRWPVEPPAALFASSDSLRSALMRNQGE